MNNSLLYRHTAKLEEPNIYIGRMEALFFLSLGLPSLQIIANITLTDILGLLVFAKFLLKRKKVYIRMYLLVTALLFYIGALLGLANSNDIIRSFTGILHHSFIMILLPIILFQTTGSQEALKQVLSWYLYGAFISVGFVLIFIFFGYGFGIVDTVFLTGRVTLTTYGPNVVARLFCIAALITLDRVFEQKRKSAMLLELFKYFLFIFGLFTTVSSSGIGLTAVGSVMIFCYHLRANIRKRYFQIFVILSLFIIIGVALTNNYTFNQQIDKLIFRELTLNSYDQGGLHNRLAQLEGITELLIQYWFFGVGYACSSYETGITIHFPLIASFVETGIFGFISCLLLYAYPWICVLKKPHRKRFSMIGIVMLVIFVGDMIQPNPNYRFTWMALFMPCIHLTDAKNNEVAR